MADGGYNLFTATNMKMTPLGMVAGHGFDFAKPVINGLRIMPLRFLRFGAFPPYYGDEINIGFWGKLGLTFGAPDNASRKVKVVVIGDSISAGTPFTDNKPGEKPNDYASWTATFRELSGYQVINQAIGGTTTTDTLARFQQDVVALNPDYCIVEHGNDCWFGIDNFNITKGNIDAIANICTTNNIGLIFVQPVARLNMTAYGTAENLVKYKQYMLRMHEYEESLGYPSFIGYYDPLDESTDIVNQALLADGVHPSIEGYRMVGEWLTPQLMGVIGNSVIPSDTIYTLQPDYKYIYNLSKKTFTIYDENGTVVFYVTGVTKISDMKIDFTVHKSHQFEIVVNADDISDWDYLPVSTKPQDFEATSVDVPDKGIQHIYTPDRVRPYTLLDGDNPTWSMRYIGDLWENKIAKDINVGNNNNNNEYHYIMQKQLTGLLKINETLYNTKHVNNFYSVYCPWIDATRLSSNSKMKMFGKMGLLLPKLSLSLYPALNIVIRIDEVFNNRAVYEPWLIWWLKFIWPMYTEDSMEEFPIDVLDLSPSWD